MVVCGLQFDRFPQVVFACLFAFKVSLGFMQSAGLAFGVDFHSTGSIGKLLKAF